MTTATIQKIQEEHSLLPTSFFKTSQTEEIHFFLKGIEKLKPEVSVWVNKGANKIIKPARFKQLTYDTHEIVIEAIDTLSELKGSPVLFVYIPQQTRNILFSTVIKFVDGKQAILSFPNILFIHELREEKRLEFPIEVEVPVEFGFTKGDTIHNRKGRILDISEHGLAIFLEVTGDLHLHSGDKINILSLPLQNIKYPFEAEIRYLRLHTLKQGRFELKGYRIGCQIKALKLPIKHKA